MNKRDSLLDELRVRYEALPESTDDHGDVDRLECVTLEFPSTAIEEPVLEDLARLILGHDSGFLKRGRLAGLRGRASSWRAV